MRPVLVVLTVTGALTCSTPAAAPATPRAVRLVTLTPRAATSTARYSGVLEAGTQLDLAFRVPGRVASVGRFAPGSRELQEGDTVIAGAVLATLDLDDLRRQHRAAAASLAQAVAQVRTARTSLGQAEKEASRARRMFAAGDLAQAELDRAESAFATASSNLGALEAQQQARIEQLALAQSTLTDATLVSPIEGVISRKAIDPGELVVPNVPVFTVLRLDELKLAFGVPDTRINLVQLAQRVPVTVEALPGRLVEGTVSKVAPTADPSLRTYAVELRLSRADGLKPGMTATAQLAGTAEPEALLVPLSAVVRTPGGEGYSVFALREDSTVEPLAVEVADLLENDVVLASLALAGRRVVTDGAAFLRAGEQVVVTP